jgi:hypothetical protein
MAKGGKRQGAGAKRGSKQKRTLEKMEYLRLFRERVMLNFDHLITAQLLAATGVSHLFARAKTGKFKAVTDPVSMEEVLNGPEELKYISARDPDPRALKDMWDRMWGSPTQAVDVTVKKEPASQTDEELAATAAALLAKVKGR